MNIPALIIGLGPLIGWGLFPTVASKIGGKPIHQIIGTTLGTLIFAFIYSLIIGIEFASGMNLWLAMISGIGWASAQLVTFYCFGLIGSSKAMPITSAFQLLGTSLWGVLALGDWPSLTAKLFGALGLILIIYGASLTVWTEKSSSENSSLLKKAVLLLAVGEIGYWAYSAAPQATTLSGQEAFLPQAIGMVLVSVIYSIYLTLKNKETFAFKEVVAYKQIISGLFFAFGALTYLISAQPNMNGLATGFILSQTSVVLATLTGIWFLGQKKTKREMRKTVIGLILILLAATITVIL